MPSAHIIFASTSGHTEHVVQTLGSALETEGMEVTFQRAEEAGSDDVLLGDMLILACGTWNTGGKEGQLNMHMDALLRGRANEVDLQGKPCAVIALGDDRYYYTGRATEHLMQFIMQHNGKSCCPPLLIVNEPYGQEEKVQDWGKKLQSTISSS
jgi:flavodoxin I